LSAAAASAVRLGPRPSFLGSVGSEALKLRRQRLVWAMLGLALVFFAVLTAALLQADGVRSQLQRTRRRSCSACTTSTWPSSTPARASAC
jgi:hypothetical protein